MENKIKIPQKNDIVTLDIIDINNLGHGVGKLPESGIVAFVPGAVSGDVVRAKLIKVNKSYCVGHLEEILSPSPRRLQEKFCEAPNSCGGCVYRHITYDHELCLKKNYVEFAFKKAGLSDVIINDVITATKEARRYRNKAQYPVKLTKNGAEAGFYAAKTHNIIPISDCQLQPEIFGEIVSDVCRFVDDEKISVYDELTGKGLLRHIYLRHGKGTGEIMLCLIINGDSLPCREKFAEFIVKKHPQIKSVILNINKKSTNVVLGDEYETVFGNSYITDILCGKKFMISAGSFYQVNHDGAELLYGVAAKRAGLSGEETVLDLYCGIGTIGLSMADKAKEIIGIEIVDEAVRCAEENAALNGIKNAKYFCGDASGAKELFSGVAERLKNTKNIVAVIDPPRKGSTPELIEYLAELKIPKIVYVSCDPDTLARDCVLFRTLGYNIGDVTPVDMFPRTGHCECVTLLTKSY